MSVFKSRNVMSLLPSHWLRLLSGAILAVPIFPVYKQRTSILHEKSSF